MSITTFWNNATTAAGSSYAGFTTAQIIATTTPATFAGWSASAQTALIRANGSGTPKALVIGPSGNQVLATLLSNSEVIQSLVPTGFGNQPVGLDYESFSSWSQDLQSAYVQKNGTALGYNTTAFTATLDASGTSVSLSPSTALAAAMATNDASTLSLASDKVTAAAFFGMSTADQLKYVQLKVTQLGSTYVRSNPPTLAIDTATLSNGGLTIALKSGSTSFKIVVPQSTYGISDAAPTLSGTSAGRTFAAWPDPVQVAYLAAQGGSSYPKVVAFGDPTPDGRTAILKTSADTAVVLTANPPGYAAYSATNHPPVDVFMSWPQAVQIAFVRKAGQAGATTASLALSNLTVTVQNTAAGSTTPISYSATRTLNAAPSAVDPSAFGLWPAFDQALFFTLNRGSGTPQTVTIGSGTFRTLLTLDAGGLSVTATPYPKTFALPPSDLDAADFLTWSPLFRDLYLKANGATTTTTTGSVTNTVVSATVGAQITASSLNGAAMQITTSRFSPTRGENQDTLPYNHLPGSAVGTTSAVNETTASSLFPLYDGSTTAQTALPLPANFGVEPALLAPSDFASWNTSQQLAYLKTKIATGQSLAIGASTGSTINVFVSAPVTPQTTNPKVYIAQNLQKQDIAKMALSDQLTLAGIASFQVIAKSLGLIPDGTTATTAAGALVVVNALFTAATSHMSSSGTTMPTADQQVFAGEITLLQSQLSGAAIFSLKDIQDKITAIQTRFDRASAFAADLYPNMKIASLDNNAGIKSGYQTFMTQEETIFDLANRASQLARTGIQAGTQQNLDVPNLVFLFQLYTNLTGEAIIRADTEEVNQTNQLLQMYSAMQAIINQTVGAFGTDNTQKRPLQGSSNKTDNNGNTFMTADEIAVVQMFSSSYGTPVRHPIEILKNMQRSVITTGQYTTFANATPDKDGNKNTSNFGEDDELSTHWNQFGTNLSDNVTLINQDSQLKMNDINSQTKQKDRNFDLANNALSKMTDIIQQIGNTIN